MSLWLFILRCVLLTIERTVELTWYPVNMIQLTSMGLHLVGQMSYTSCVNQTVSNIYPVSLSSVQVILFIYYLDWMHCIIIKLYLYPLYVSRLDYSLFWNIKTEKKSHKTWMPLYRVPKKLVKLQQPYGLASSMKESVYICLCNRLCYTPTNFYMLPK